MTERKLCFCRAWVNEMDAVLLKAVMLGHAVADALGVPVEFRSREMLDVYPVTEMLGFGTYDCPAGTWSDDTSMSLCALDALAAGYCDPDAVMRNFGRWYYNNEYTAGGSLFDIGATCRRAIVRYASGQYAAIRCGDAEESSNGNGSLMRIHPFVLYLLERDGEITREGLSLIHAASALTHAHRRSKLGCGIYACVLEALIRRPVRAAVYEGLAKAKALYEGERELSVYARLLADNFADLPVGMIESSGYIVHTLEAALWCLLTTDSYAACVLRAVNLGLDTDTVAAVAGGLAGALYGLNGIPTEWLDTLLRRDYIEELCETTAATWAGLRVRVPMTDFHVHIVPSVDDGAVNPDMAMDMLAMFYSQGVRTVFCTSHSSADAAEYDAGYAALVRTAAVELPDMTLYRGCEIYCSDACIPDLLVDLRADRLRTLGDSLYVLLEFAMPENSAVIEATVAAFAAEGYRPVLAHAERYSAMDDEALVARLIAAGGRIQVNAYSLVEESDIAIKDRARSLLAAGRVSFLGSDAHRLTHRPPRVMEGVRYICASLSPTAADRLLSGAAWEAE